MAEQQATIREFMITLANRIDCSGTVSFAENLAAARQLICTVMKCERASILLLTPESETLTDLADDNATLVSVDASGDGMVGRALRDDKVLTLEDAFEHPDYDLKDADEKAGRETRSCASVPIRLAADKATAVVLAFDKDESVERGVFNDYDIKKLRLLGQLCAANMLMAGVAAATPGMDADAARDFGRQFAANELEAAHQAFEFAGKVIPADVARTAIMMGEEFDVEQFGDQQTVLYENDLSSTCNANRRGAVRNASDTEGADFSLLAAPIVPGNHDALGHMVWARSVKGERAAGFSDDDASLATGVGLLMGLALAKGWCFEEFPQEMLVSAASVARITPIADRTFKRDPAPPPAPAAAEEEPKPAEDEAKPAADDEAKPAEEEAAAAPAADAEEAKPAADEPAPAPADESPAATTTAVVPAADAKTPARQERAAMEDLSPYGYDVSHSPITDSQLRVEFSHYDVDGSGMLSKAEFKRQYLSLDWAGLPPSDKEFERTWARYCGADEQLSYNEFCLFMLRRSRM